MIPNGGSVFEQECASASGGLGECDTPKGGVGVSLRGGVGNGRFKLKLFSCN